MNVSVFCSASDRIDAKYLELAYAVGENLAKRGHTVVFGGGKVGMMGKVADGALSNGGAVIGVIPEQLQQREVAHLGLTELLVVNTMHDRKLLMHQRSDASITLPGGMGTLDELVEIITWKQLTLHDQPIGLCNAYGYFDHLIALMDQMHEEKFTHGSTVTDMIVENNFELLLDKVEAWEPR